MPLIFVFSVTETRMFGHSHSHSHSHLLSSDDGILLEEMGGPNGVPPRHHSMFRDQRDKSVRGGEEGGRSGIYLGFPIGTQNLKRLLHLAAPEKYFLLVSTVSLLVSAAVNLYIPWAMAEISGADSVVCPSFSYYSSLLSRSSFTPLIFSWFNRKNLLLQ